MTTFANFTDYKSKVLSEMKRVLRDDGYIIISVFSKDAFEERMKIYKKLNVPIKEIKGTTVIFDKEIGDNISEQFSKEQLRDIFNKVNLNVIDIRKKGIAYLCKLKK
jgi:ubiquinone/menaquinone biosynthesis C-methylase UbiE